MKRILFIVLLVAASAPVVHAQVTSAKADQSSDAERAAAERKLAAKTELNEAARSYRNGKFAEAQRHAEKALEVDPDNKTASAFVARIIHAQYKPGVNTPENIAKARDALAAYQRILANDPINEEAYKAVAALYGALREDQQQRDWIMQRAYNGTVPDKQRAEAFLVLASKDWDCAYKITELPQNKQTVVKDNRPVIIYKKPEDQNSFERAKQCATSGLQMVETAINLDLGNESAWSYKANLLLEMTKLAEMEGADDVKANFARQADEAQQHTAELNTQNRKKRETGASVPTSAEHMPSVIGGMEMTTLVAPVPKSTDTPPSSPSPTGKIVSGGVLNSKAISLPEPLYPPIARNAHASGTVTVQVTVDENGNVISARAVSGHPLLQAAAVQAARQAVFSPTTLSGEPVKVTGVLTYNFAMPQ